MGKRRRQEIAKVTVRQVSELLEHRRHTRRGRVPHPQRGAPVGVGGAVGRCRQDGGPRHRDRVGLRGGVRRRHRHRQRVGPDVEVQFRLALGARVVVVRDGHRRRGVLLPRRQRHRVDPVDHRGRVGFGSAIEVRAQQNGLAAGRALQFQISQRHVGGGAHLEHLREPVHGAGVGRPDEAEAVDRAAAGGGGIGTADTRGRLAKPERSPSEIRLFAVVLAARQGEVGGLAGIGPVGAEFILVVGLVVPAAVVEVLVVVGDLVSVEPVDGHARAGDVVGAGVGGGVRIGGAADHPEGRAVGLDVGVPGGGAALDEGVVVRDVVRRAVGTRRGEEQQPELIAGDKPGRNQDPVVGNLDLAGRGGRGRPSPRARDRHRVVLGVVDVVLRRHRHDDLVVVLGERGHRDTVAEVGVGDRGSVQGDAGHRRVRIVHRRGQRHRGDGVAHVRVVVERARHEGRGEGPVVRPVVDHERAQLRVGGGAHLENHREAVEPMGEFDTG